MKKFLMAICAVAVATTVATAGVGINWNVAYGVFDHDATTLTTPPTANHLLDSYSAIWQLIYAGPNNVIDPIPNPATPAQIAPGGINGDYVQGDDIVWGQREIPMGGGSANDAPYNTSWDDWMTQTGGNATYEDLSWVTAGFVYQRIFENTPAQGTWYYESDLQALNTGYVGGGQPPMDFFVDTPSAGAQPTEQINVVPEPATMSLLGLGALVMAIRRRRS